MSTINPTLSNLQNSLNPTDASNANSTSAADLQNRFFTLLVAQMKNQDPLNPMDNSQVTSQMAQLSTVSGINQLNASMQSMATGFASNQLLQSASMIGKQILAPGSTMQLTNSTGTFGLDLPQAASQVTVSIIDGSGHTVHSVNLGTQPAGTQMLQWDGMTDSGAQAADGNYSVQVKATSDGQNVAATPLVYGTVQGVSSNTAGVTLNLGSAGTVNLSDVKQIL